MTFAAYPRLDAWGANRLLEQLRPLGVEELARRAETSHPRTHFQPTALSRKSDEDLRDLRQQALALVAGLPATREGFRAFDARMGRLMGSLVDLSPAEGGRPEVWNHMSLVLLPDLTLWRWRSSGDGSLHRDRLLGGPRNALRRLWWRNLLLGEELVDFLSEDELVGITERPGSLGSCPLVARAFAEVLRSQVAAGHVPAGMREAVSRAYARAALRRGAVLALPAMAEKQLESVFRGAIREATLEVLGPASSRAGGSYRL
ncbi:hypothetical protein SAMN05445756_0426 [Kytococcus aerolatus]|uniref:Uncharacterized protein n=1 Tax=Kytococcus aerolatus TaxID=592308 RepID=A0A212T5W8_9MICO|nr:hypothetical protein SAMN05445756_0426 [Kytococcus aerolatus]